MSKYFYRKRASSRPLFCYCKQQVPGALPLDVLDQAARRAAFTRDECEEKDRMAGASCWSKAEGFALLATLRRNGHPC